MLFRSGLIKKTFTSSNDNFHDIIQVSYDFRNHQVYILQGRQLVNLSLDKKKKNISKKRFIDNFKNFSKNTYILPGRKR